MHVCAWQRGVGERSEWGQHGERELIWHLIDALLTSVGRVCWALQLITFFNLHIFKAIKARVFITDTD